MLETQMPEVWENETRVIAAIGIAYSIAALAMQVFSLTKTRPDSDKSLRALLRRVAPPAVSDSILAAAEDAIKIALQEASQIEQRTSKTH